MMRLPKFEYHVPQTIAEAVRIRGEVGPAGQFVAGGTDLYPNMKRRQQTPQTVISVMRRLASVMPAIVASGELELGGEARLNGVSDYRVNASMAGANIAFRSGDVNLSKIRMSLTSSALQ